VPPKEGLKQSLRAWFKRFTKAIISLWYKQRQGDHTLFIKYYVTCKLILLLVYANDMIIVGDDETKELALRRNWWPNLKWKTSENLSISLE